MAIEIRKLFSSLFWTAGVLLKLARKAATQIRPMKQMIRPNPRSILRAKSFMLSLRPSMMGFFL
jgi:hypothetical protein